MSLGIKNLSIRGLKGNGRKRTWVSWSLEFGIWKRRTSIDTKNDFELNLLHRIDMLMSMIPVAISLLQMIADEI